MTLCAIFFSACRAGCVETKFNLLREDRISLKYLNAITSLKTSFNMRLTANINFKTDSIGQYLQHKIVQLLDREKHSGHGSSDAGILSMKFSYFNCFMRRSIRKFNIPPRNPPGI